ncbi:MCE family protein [Nocardioides sp. R1-1]|uniref:MCE family protein n=1 Tax=Nocardioides sp. R1-1 TaxID=3383502 RepID=UPI0038D078F1
MSSRRLLLVGTGVLLVAVVLGGVRLGGWLGGDDDAMVVTADFADTTGVYVGNDVTYLGVPVGEIVAVEPHGTTMRVVMHLERGTELPRDAGAQILQGSLVTDRFVELGPAYAGGPRLRPGAHIAATHTRSPANVDAVAAAIDDLVVALNAAEDGGHAGIGEALDTAAATLEGNGAHLRRALSESRDALAMLNAKDEDLTAVTANLGALVDVLAERDATIRGFTRATADTTALVADQSDELAATLGSLDELTRLMNRFLRDNGAVIGDDLAGLAQVVATVQSHQDSLEEAFDTMPTMAENFARAYDWDLGRLRVQFSFGVGPFAAAFRDHTCQVFGQALAGQVGSDVCRLIFNPSGTGLLDPILDGLYDGLPGGFP